MVDIVVRARPGHSTKGIISLGHRSFYCALGRSGINAQKREGDGHTPAGSFRLLAAFYRPDRVMRPITGLPLKALKRDDGWCDAPEDPRYNRSVKIPCSSSCENMWRSDGLYDLGVILDQNFTTRKRFGGSAIFFHVASAGLNPTEGCVAVPLETMTRLICEADRETRMRILL
ncbi:MAG: L,D-transpeptidase family protein [Stappiaceae bacterium]